MTPEEVWQVNISISGSGSWWSGKLVEHQSLYSFYFFIVDLNYRREDLGVQDTKKRSTKIVILVAAFPLTVASWCPCVSSQTDI